MRIIILVACLWAATSPLYGKIVFHSQRDGNTEIYTMDSDGSNQTRLTFNKVSDAYPTWSPNGQQIAFASSRDGNREVYVMNVDGTNQRNLSNHPTYDSLPDWSPDGSQIVFTSSRDRNPDKNLYANIYVMDTDGGDVKQITHMEFASSPRWLPDGKRIAFEAEIGIEDRQIYVVDADGRNPWQVSIPKVNTSMHLNGWSPDGKQILYTEAIESRSDKATPFTAILGPIRHREVIRWQRVLVPPMPFNTAVFSTDGKSILFSGKRNDDWEIYQFQLADRQLIQLTDILGKDAAPDEWDSRLPVSPEGLTPTHWGEIKTTK